MNTATLRTLIGALTLSAAGLVGILSWEGYRGEAHIPVAGDVPTIGYGTTEGVKLGDRTTPEQALARALRDVTKFEGAIRQCVAVPLHQHEYDAYVSLAYNIGPAAFCGSTLVKKLNGGDYEGACSEILRWTYFHGHDCKRPEHQRLCGGLADRRQAEFQHCMKR